MEANATGALRESKKAGGRDFNVAVKASDVTSGSRHAPPWMYIAQSVSGPGSHDAGRLSESGVCFVGTQTSTCCKLFGTVE